MDDVRPVLAEPEEQDERRPRRAEIEHADVHLERLQRFQGLRGRRSREHHADPGVLPAKAFREGHQLLGERAAGVRLQIENEPDGALHLWGPPDVQRPVQEP